MKREMRAMGEAEGKVASFACGPAEVPEHTKHLALEMVLRGRHFGAILKCRGSLSI